VTFLGPAGGEATGVVDLLAERKNFGTPRPGLKRGDELQMLLIQVKGRTAGDPTKGDMDRLRKVARLHGASEILLANWKKGTAARFFRLRPKPAAGAPGWTPVKEIDTIFR